MFRPFRRPCCSSLAVLTLRLRRLNILLSCSIIWWAIPELGPLHVPAVAEAWQWQHGINGLCRLNRFRMFQAARLTQAAIKHDSIHLHVRDHDHALLLSPPSVVIQITARQPVLSSSTRAGLLHAGVVWQHGHADLPKRHRQACARQRHAVS